MQLIKVNSFLEILLPNLAISYKKVDEKVVVTGFYRKISLNTLKKFDL